MATIVFEFKGIKVGETVKVKRQVGIIDAVVDKIIAGDYGTATIYVVGVKSGKRYNASDSDIIL